MVGQIVMHCTENLIYVFPEVKLHGLIPNSYIHEFVSDLYSQDRSAYLAAAEYWQTNPVNI